MVGKKKTEEKRRPPLWQDIVFRYGKGGEQQSAVTGDDTFSTKPIDYGRTERNGKLQYP